MTMFTITDGDRISTNVDRSTALELGYTEEAVDAAEAEADERQQKLQRRTAIDQTVGDLPSLFGTIADVMGLLVAGQMARVVALADHASNETQRQELAALKALAGDADLVQLCRDGLAAIEAGQVVLTAKVKGTDAVFAEALTRSTATAGILAGADDA